MRMFQVSNMFSFQKLRHNELFILSLPVMLLFSRKYTLWTTRTNEAYKNNECFSFCVNNRQDIVKLRKELYSRKQTHLSQETSMEFF